MKNGEIKIIWNYIDAKSNPMSDKNRLELRFIDNHGYDKFAVIEDVILDDDIDTDKLIKALLSM